MTEKTPLKKVEVALASDLDEFLPLADHIAPVLPGDPETDGYLAAARLMHCKPGACVYNFGRGNALRSDDLIAVADHLGGAFLDVVDEQPLPPGSPLWQLPNIMVTPHSSCVYRDYKRLFLEEVAEALVGARQT